MYYKTVCPTPVGTATLASDGHSLVGLWLEGQTYFGGTIADKMARQDDIPVFDAAKKWLERYFAGEKPLVSELPLAPIGNEFRQDVWDVLCQIPYGEVVTYGDIAKKTAEKRNRLRMSAQAVGGAVAHNPISIIIPCHRVIGSNGNLTGYAGGIDVKIKLLASEGIDTSSFFVPEKGTAV